MRTIKIVLASSEELNDDRNAFGNLVRRLDKIYEKRGIRIELFEWEDCDATYNDRRKQDEYNDQIKASDMFLALFHTKAGKLTIEEFDVATEEFRKHASPKIYTYCKDLAEGEQESPELIEFKRKLFEEMGHYWSRYNNRDSMQLHFVMQLQLVETSGTDEILKVEDGTVMLDSLPIAKMDDLQFASSNEAFQNMKAELSLLPEKIEKARKRVEKYPDDDDLKEELQQLQDQYRSLKEEVEKESQLLLDFSRNVTILQGGLITDRMKRAIDAFYRGNVHEAKIILAEAEHDSRSALDEYKQSVDITEQKRQVAILSLNELLLTISATMADMSIPIDERIPHAIDLYKRCDEIAQTLGYEPLKYERLLHQYARFLYDYAHYKDSIAIIERQIKLLIQLYGERDVRIAYSYNIVGLAYWYLGEHMRAIDFLYKSLEIKETVLGSEHPDLIASYINIAAVYNEWGMHSAAIENLEKALKIGLKVYGEKHPVIATIYNNFGFAYYSLGDYENALDYHYQALAIREKILREHPETAISYNSIGLIKKNQKDYTKALDYYTKALNIQEKLLGVFHPDTATTYNNIGSLYHIIGDKEKAIEFHLKGIKGREHSLGANNIDTAKSYWNIAHVYLDLNQADKALFFFSRALPVFEKELGKEQPYTASCYEKIADLFLNKKDIQKALEHYSLTVKAYHAIGSKYQEQKDYNYSLYYFDLILSICLRTIGPNHNNTASAYWNVAGVYDRMEEYDKAIENYKLALEIQKVNEDSEDTAATYNALGQVYYHKKDYENALECHEASLKIKRSIYKEDDINIANSCNNLGFVYIGMRKLDMAITYMSEALAIYKKTLGEEHEQCMGLKNYISQMKSELEQESQE